MIVLDARTTPPTGQARIIAETYPFGTQYRCTGCRCHVSPTCHRPGSEDCERSAAEREASIRE